MSGTLWGYCFLNVCSKCKSLFLKPFLLLLKVTLIRPSSVVIRKCWNTGVMNSSTCAWGNMFPSSLIRTHPGLTCSCKHTSMSHARWTGPEERMSSSCQIPRIPTSDLHLSLFSLSLSFHLSYLLLPVSPSSPLTCTIPSSNVCVCVCLIFACPVFVVAASLSSETGRGVYMSVWSGILFTLWQGKEAGQCVCVCITFSRDYSQSGQREKQEMHKKRENTTWKTAGNVCWTGWPNTHAYTDKHAHISIH